jgi:RHS repeat-associated protein
MAYYRARWLDPSIGTWISPDPLAQIEHDTRPELVSPGDTGDGENNLYAFVNASPSNRLDPFGLWSERIHTRITRSVLLDLLWHPVYVLQAISCNAYVDRVSNTANNNQHGMSDVGQPREDAIRTWSVFVTTRFAAAEAKLCAGNRLGAACEIGQALHAIQDRWAHAFTTLPAHINPARILRDQLGDYEGELFSDLDSYEAVDRFMQSNPILTEQLYGFN